MDWWGLIHKAMTELPWGSPENVKRMTVPQLACLASERPIGTGPCATREEFLREAARIEAAEAAWGG
jgi:hypothetical protein